MAPYLDIIARIAVITLVLLMARREVQLARLLRARLRAPERPRPYNLRMPLLTAWFDIPASLIARQRADGVKKPVARIAMRPLTGEDQEAALRACGNAPLLLRDKMVLRSLCGVAFADAEDKAGPELLVSIGQDDPDLQPVNLYASMHIAIVTLVGLAFGDLNDGDSEEIAAFRKSRRGVMA